MISLNVHGNQLKSEIHNEAGRGG